MAKHSLKNLEKAFKTLYDDVDGEKEIKYDNAKEILEFMLGHAKTLEYKAEQIKLGLTGLIAILQKHHSKEDTLSVNTLQNLRVKLREIGLLIKKDIE